MQISGGGIYACLQGMSTVTRNKRTTQFKYGNSTLIYGIVIKSVYMPDQDMGKSAINFMVAYNSGWMDILTSFLTILTVVI